MLSISAPPTLPREGILEAINKKKYLKSAFFSLQIIKQFYNSLNIHGFFEII
jgi:hypothetical protein